MSFEMKSRVFNLSNFQTALEEGVLKFLSFSLIILRWERTSLVHLICKFE